MTTEIIQELLDLGDDMLTALENGETDVYLDLLHNRGLLIDRLSELRPATDDGPDRERIAAALVSQNEVLIRTAEARCQQLRDAVKRMEQVKEAQRSYRRPTARRNILNDNLRV